jgi:hypothetical protein
LLIGDFGLLIDAIVDCGLAIDAIGESLIDEIVDC